MKLSPIDWGIVLAFLVVYLLVGFFTSKKAGKDLNEYFLSGRNMPWWMLGISMVATTFSSDTPNLVTDIVRQNGISGNWVWWAFLLTGMLTVFVYARLWRRSGIATDLEFYELRYSGKAAVFLRAFRAIYLGFFFNIFIMATVTLAMIKIAGVLLNIEPITTVIIASAITVIYSSLGGLRSVIITDFLQFTIAMVGAIGAGWYLINLPEVGGLSALLADVNVSDKLAIFPGFDNPSVYVPLLVIPLAVQWWSVWYPGAEPGGGGYIAQRMLAAKNEDHAIKATLLFNLAHYALRPWPWIVVALCSLVVFPDLQSLSTAFPDLPASVIKHDLAYPAMLSYLPVGLLGLVVASLISAFMSTVSTHLNWGSSYLVIDFYQRMFDRNASQKKLVNLGRLCTVVLMILAGLLSLVLESALQAFNILIQIGAGTGLLFILRWFWYRVNAYSEITAMAVSFLLAIYFQLVHAKLGFEPIQDHIQLILGIAITTVCWVVVTLLTKPANTDTLQKFVEIINPGGPGWKNFPINGADKSKTWALPFELLAMLTACALVYSVLIASGMLIFGNTKAFVLLGGLAILSLLVLNTLWRKIKELRRA
jgi:solute:Na+ symporter, SSS family